VDFESSDPTKPAPENGSTSKSVLILPTSVEQDLDESDESLGSLGHPFDHRAPFFIGLAGAFGVAVAYEIFRGIADVSSVLIIIGLALFIAVGLDPILRLLVKHGVPRGLAVGIVTLGFVLVVVVFVLAAVSPLNHEIQSIVKNYPRYKANLIAGKGWAGKLAVKLHLTSYLKGTKKLKIPLGGVLGAGKLTVSIAVQCSDFCWAAAGDDGCGSQTDWPRALNGTCPPVVAGTGPFGVAGLIRSLTA
jgi:hypothetical protein